jgi:hypothetical protein
MQRIKQTVGLLIRKACRQFAWRLDVLRAAGVNGAISVQGITAHFVSFVWWSCGLTIHSSRLRFVLA